MSIDSKIKEILGASVVEETRKNINISLTESMISDIDQVTLAFQKVTNGKSFTRQWLIEESIKEWLEESKKILSSEYGISDIYELEEPVNEEKEFDTLILPAQYDGFNETFLGEDKWYYVRINSKKIPKLKNLALYVGKPVSAITHYAKIDRFELDETTGRYIVYFKGKAIKLSKEIPLGDATPMSVRSPRYVMLDKLIKANTYEDLC